MKAIFYLCVALKIKSILFPLFYFLFFWGIEVTIQMPNYKFVCNQYNPEQNAKLSFGFTILGNVNLHKSRSNPEQPPLRTVVTFC